MNQQKLWVKMKRTGFKHNNQNLTEFLIQDGF
jgi:hypothetical protein